MDHDELGWSILCSFESFEVQMGEGPRTSSRAAGPLSEENIEGNSELYYDASASWEVKSEDEECPYTHTLSLSLSLSLVVDYMWDHELCRRKSSVIASLRTLLILDRV